MDASSVEKKVFDAIASGNWNTAIEHATHVPSHHDIWQRMPSAAPIPDEAINKILDTLTHPWGQQKKNIPSFMFEMTHNLPDNIRPETLNRLGEVINEYYPNSHIETQQILNHPNFKLDENGASLKRASDFWHEYEMKVQPHHFATIKSMYTNKPEFIKDHRGAKGNSDRHVHLIPDIKNHAAKIQELIMKDSDIKKKIINGEPHIRLFRGVNGHYGSLIRDNAHYKNHTNEADRATFHIPTANLTSWTVDSSMAARFAHNRGNIENQPKDQGVVLASWIPVKSVLHSGFHKSNLTQQHAHPIESEVVIGHPDGKFQTSTEDMLFQDSSNPEKFSYAELPEDEKLAASEIHLTYDDLAKGFKNSIVPAVTALTLLGAPQDTKHVMPHNNMPSHVQQMTTPNPVQHIDTKEQVVDSGLTPIKMIESSGGLNTDHKEVRGGMHSGMKAYGKFGLMPSTIVETVKRSPAMSNKYHPLVGLDYKKDHDRIHQVMGTDPNMEIDIANAHWNRLRGIFGNNTDKMAYAWYNGITGAKRASDEQIKKHPYVQKYNKYKKMSDLENVKKNEALTPQIGISKFIGFSNVEQNKKYVKDINSAIASNELHNLSHSGRFTHDSFVAGFDPNNSWLVKIEPFGNRPGIDSARYGLQVIKEAAFYQIANKIFGLGNVTPQAILGEIEKDGTNWPAVAIKMYPKVYISAHDMEASKPDSVRSILEKYRKTGELHKMAAMLYILGDADAHGNNVMTDGYQVKLIDHGTSFANENFNPADEENVFVPYILRAWGYKDNMDAAEKMEHMPKIDSKEAKDHLKHWIHNLDTRSMMDLMMRFSLDPKPAMVRLKTLQRMIQTQDPDEAINHLWVYGNNGVANDADARRYQANQ